MKAALLDSGGPISEIYVDIVDLLRVELKNVDLGG
jgi:hypothetical protein